MNLHNLYGNHAHKMELVKKALESLTDPTAASAHKVPPIHGFRPVCPGELNNGVLADFKIDLAPRRHMFIRIITRFDTRPSRCWRQKIIRKQKAAGIFAPAIFIFIQESVESILRKIADIVRSELAKVEHKWQRCKARHRWKAHFVAFKRNPAKFPSCHPCQCRAA